MTAVMASRSIVILLAFFLVGLVFVPSSMAATISMDGQDLLYQAAVNETNRVVVTNGSNVNEYIITDNGATTISSTTANCSVVGHQATCDFGNFNDPVFSLGNRNDTFSASSSDYQYAFVVYGDAGSDTLTGGRGDDYLGGDAGSDTLFGGRGDDYLAGGSGTDLYNGGRGSDLLIAEDRADGSDTMNGGRGFDCADYGFRGKRSIKASLDGRRNDGFVGERDKIGTDVECIFGGEGSDTLTGNSRGGGNRLFGGSGSDTINGLGGADFLAGDDGNDMLIGGSGIDTIRGGNGDDMLRSRDESRDVVNGGAGSDKATPDDQDQLRSVEEVI